MTLRTTEELPPGEWARHPASLQEEAYRDGWLQRLGGRPLYYLRYLTSGELAAWDAGYAAARLSLVCVMRADVVIQEEVLAAAAAEPLDDVVPPVKAAELPAPVLPAPVLPAAPEAPYFDGSQVCAQVDPELFFPEKGGTTTGAKKLCTTCEFLAPCLEYAMTTRINGVGIAGVWGGTSEGERRRMRRAAAHHELDVVDEDLVDLEDEAVA